MQAPANGADALSLTVMNAADAVLSPERVALALAAMGAVLWALDPGAARWLALQVAPWQRVAALAGIVSAGAMVYFCVLGLAGFRIRDFKRNV